MKNSLQDILDSTKPSKLPTNATEDKPQLIISHLKSTGLIKVVLHQSKTKDNVDHVGPSQPSVHWKELITLQPRNLTHSQNNNWLTVRLHMETMDVMVDLWIKLSGMLKTMESLWNQLIHTEELEDHASILIKTKLGPFQIALMSPLLRNKHLLPLLPNNQSQ